MSRDIRVFRRNVVGAVRVRRGIRARARREVLA